MSMHYRVKHRCFKLLHHLVIICVRLLTFASPIQQTTLSDLIFLVLSIYGKIADYKIDD